MGFRCEGVGVGATLCMYMVLLCSIRSVSV